MRFRTLGKTSLEVSVIGLGTHQFSGEWAKEFSADEVQRLLDRAYQLGINFLDTAECYGDHQVESLVGAAIKGRRADWILATKFGHRYVSASEKHDVWSASEVRQQLDKSLKALRTDYVDLYQFHSGTNEAFENEALWQMLNGQIQAGKIRFLGISLAAKLLSKNDLRQVRAAANVNASVIQVVYNRLHRDAERELLPFCEAAKLGVLARVPLAKGFLAGGYEPGAVFPANDTRSTFGVEFNEDQLKLVEEIRQHEVPPGQNMAQWALGWCLQNRAVSSVIVGCKNIQQLETNAAVETN